MRAAGRAARTCRARSSSSTRSSTTSTAMTCASTGCRARRSRTERTRTCRSSTTEGSWTSAPTPWPLWGRRRGDSASVSLPIPASTPSSTRRIPRSRKKALLDLEQDTALLDALGAGPEAVVVVHVGGVYGDKAAATDRFAWAWERLSERAKERVAIENDESSLRRRGRLELHRRLGVRVVFDRHHHRCKAAPTLADLREAVAAVYETWPAGVRPKVHLSSPRTALDAKAPAQARTARRLRHAVGATRTPPRGSGADRRDARGEGERTSPSCGSRSN